MMYTILLHECFHPLLCTIAMTILVAHPRNHKQALTFIFMHYTITECLPDTLEIIFLAKLCRHF